MRDLKIVKTFFEYLFFHRFNRHSNKILGRRIREACEELGVTFTKFGQMLSTRYDFLSEKDCEELQKLLDKVPQISYEKIREIFKTDFGKYPEELFSEFDPIPLASASVSQVYKAKLFSGEEVAVKVRRPYIGESIKKDMKFLRKIIGFAQLFSARLRKIHTLDIVDEMKSWILEEINFENELNNIKLMKSYYGFCDGKRLSSKLGKIKFVDAYPDYCSKNILTMNFIEGIPLNRIKDIYDHPDYDIFTSLKTYMNSTVHLLFSADHDYVLQIDTHPANILIMKHGDVASIDHGMLGNVSQENLVKVRRLFLAVYSGDVDRAFKASLELCNIRKVKNPRKLKMDLERYISKAPYESIGFWFMEPVKIFLKHRLPVPSFLSVIARGNLVFEGSLKLLKTEITTLDLIKDELKSAMRKEMLKNLLNIRYEPLLYSLSEKVRDAPELARKIIDKHYSDFKRFFVD